MRSNHVFLAEIQGTVPGSGYDIAKTTSGLVVRVIGMNGGTAPVDAGISGIEVDQRTTANAAPSGEPVLEPVTLHWSAKTDQAFQVEYSTDLETWNLLDTIVLEFEPGDYAAFVTVSESAGPRMFRYRRPSR